MKGSMMVNELDGLESSRAEIAGLAIGFIMGILLTSVGAGLQGLAQPFVISMTAGNGAAEIVADLLAMVLASAVLLALTIWLSNSAFGLPVLSWDILAAAAVVPLTCLLLWLPEAFRGWYAPVRMVAPALVAAGGAALYARLRSQSANS